VVSFGLAAACLGGGIYSGTSAQSSSAAALAAQFASDGYPLGQQAQTYATAANVLYSIAGVLAAFGLFSLFVF
jgi:hypothetical protein